MAKAKIEVEVSQEAYELGQAVLGLVKGIKGITADGKTDVTEVVALAMAQITPLVLAVQGIDQLDDEAKEDLGAFVKAFSIPLSDIPGVFVAPKTDAAPVV